MSCDFAGKRLARVAMFAAVFLALPVMEAFPTVIVASRASAVDSTPAAVAEATAHQALEHYMGICGEGVPEVASNMFGLRAKGAKRAQVKRGALRMHDDALKERRRELNDLRPQLIRRGLTRRGATAIVGAMEEMVAAVWSTLPDMADAVFDGDRGRRWSERRFRRYALDECMDRIGLVTENLARAVHTASTDTPTGPRTWGQCAPPRHEADEAGQYNFEQCLRIHRFKRLAGEHHLMAPKLESLFETSLLEYPIPAIRVSWPDSVFFDTDKDEVLPESKGNLWLVADAMSRDVGDIHLFVIGHTDDTGGHQYNQNLSERRSLSVLRELSEFGVRKDQMTATGMGEFQPVATNYTPEGRAANRRVEFMISPYEEVNHVLAKNRKVNPGYLRPSDESGELKERPPVEPVTPLRPGGTTIIGVIPIREKKLSILALVEEQLGLRDSNSQG